MEERKLPQPVTNADEYLYDIALSLRRINGTLATLPFLVKAASAPAEADPVEVPAEEEVELKEPKPKCKHRGS